MPKRVPKYLKEISTQMEGPTQGDYASEWGFAKGRDETSAWDAEINGGEYLGWWGRGKRGVYYFNDHQKPRYFTNPESYYWEAYDWYRRTAETINRAFADEEKQRAMELENPNLFSEKNIKWDTPYLQKYWSPDVSIPPYIRNMEGVVAWLRGKYEPTRQFLSEYNKKAEKFNAAIKALSDKHFEQQKIELENKKRAAEDAKYNTIVTQLGDLRNKISNLSNNVKQLRVDKDKSFSLFKSELTSKIPDPNLNVSRFEHDEDIAQLNETLQNIRGNIDKNAKKTDDSIARLQRKVNVSMMDISKRANSSIIGISKRVNEDEKKNRLFFIENKKNLLELDHKFEKVEGETLAQSNEIDNLRKDLQALGGETREFIDNTKRQEQAMKAKVAKRESVVTRTVKKAAFPDLTKRPWLKESVTGRFFQLANQW